MRRAAKRDLTEQVIVLAFKRFGWSVERLNARGCPDLLVGKGTTLLLVEVKGIKGKLTPDQEEWHAEWRGPKPRIVRTVDDVIAVNTERQP